MTAEGSDALNCYTDEYDELAKALKAALEPVGVARGDDRMEEMADYLNEKIPEAREKIADAEEQLADAEQQLTDAANKLADARKKIADGEKELTDGRAELEKQKKQYAEYEKKYEEGKQQLLCPCGSKRRTGTAGGGQGAGQCDTGADGESLGRVGAAAHPGR